jgi:hypothetical protein
LQGLPVDTDFHSAPGRKEHAGIVTFLLLYLYFESRIVYILKITIFPVNVMKAYWGVEIKLRSYNFGNKYGSGHIHARPDHFIPGKELLVSMEAG